MVGPGDVKKAKLLVSEGIIDFAVWNAQVDQPRTYVAGLFEVTKTD